MAGEPIEQIIRIIAKAEVDAAVKQASDELAKVAASNKTAFDAAKPKGFTAEVGKFKQQLVSLKPLIGSVGQLFAGFSLANLAGQGLSALVSSITEYVRSSREAEQTSERLAKRLSILGQSNQEVADRFRRTRSFINADSRADKFFDDKQATEIANVLTSLTAAFGTSDRSVEKAQRFSIALRDLGVEASEAAKAVEGFIRGQAGQSRGFATLSEIFGVEIDERNFDKITRLIELTQSLSALRAGGAGAVFGRSLGATELQEAIGAYEAAIRDLGFISTEQARIDRERTAEIEKQVALRIRERQEMERLKVELLREGRGPAGLQIKQAVEDTRSVVTVYGTARDAIGTVLGGIQDVTAATTQWALANERTALKLRSILAQIAGQLAGLIVQYALLSLLGGGGGGAVIGSAFGRQGAARGGFGGGGGVGGAGAGASGAGAPSYLGSAANAGLRTFGGGPTGDGGTAVVTEDGDEFWLRMLARHRDKVWHLWDAGRASDPGFRARTRSRI